MSRRIAQSLSAQLFCGVLLSLLAAVGAFFSCSVLGDYVLSRTVYSQSFVTRMTDQRFERLQSYVMEEQITTDHLRRLDPWCTQGRKTRLSIYQGSTILYNSAIPAGEALNPEAFDPELENPEQEYRLVLSDGMVVRAFLYYYAGNIYYFWTMVFAFMVAFGVFSLIFIAFVHRKLRYVKRLKGDLDILAGGNLDYPVTMQGKDELGELALGIDQMRRSILAHQSAENQIRSANSQLVTAMSHDLRTPLTALLAYLELMERGKYEGEAQLHHFIRQSLNKTLQIKDMADKLFEYFLVYSSEWEPTELEEMDADQVFQQLWGEYAFSLENEGFTVSTDFGLLKGSLRVNLDLLRRAFDNLYANILKYADPDQPVELTYGREGDEICLTLVNHISAQRNRRESTNIGLNTCCRVLLYHGGVFRSEEVDGLFRVIITLPLAD